MRKKGYSYSFIKEEIDVSKSTLSYWLRDIPYTPNRKVIKRVGLALAKSGEAKSQIRRKSIQDAQKEAKNIIGDFSERDLLMFGLGLYLGEGDKTMNIVRVTNSDPEVINFAIRWLSKSFGLRKKNFTLAIHLYPDNNIKRSLKFWSDKTGISLEQFGKTQVDGRTNKKNKKRGKFPHGTAKLRVKGLGNPKNGVFLARKIKAMMSEVLDKRV